MKVVSSKAKWAGHAMSWLVVAFMLLDGGMKLVPLEVTTEAAAMLGYPGAAEFTRGLGLTGIVCALLYAVPRTSVLGAILLSGYMGGTAAAHLRVGNPLFTHMLFGSYFAVLAWGGLYFRDPRIRALLPLRTARTEE